MPVLNSSQRGKLEKAIIKARELSMQGAINALRAFAVHHHEPYVHMGIEERALRNQLRTKARLLGDNTKADDGHTIGKLAYELSYEYWHRMLFARFLEANNLLIHPSHEIPVTLAECEELGVEEGHDDKWQAAAHYASQMLPAIFRQDDPLMQLRYATEDRLALEELIESIESDVFQADDSLGWVYQYWQTSEKARINKEGNPINGDSISAVTQLFTEPYMVHFLIDNTLGAWWTARNPGVIPPVEFKYLRTLDDGTPAAGSFEGWPSELKDITMLDPCMGSGHFVVDVFSVMAPLRMQAEGLSREEACDAVIKDNIHGLELDDRCTQIAAFNLALTAWKFCGQYRELPEMNLACCGIAPTGKKEDWVKLANSEQDPTKKERLVGGLARMYDLFQQAPELGSLIDPTTIEKDAFTSDFDELQPFLEAALANEDGLIKNNERGIIAAGIAKAGKLLATRYNLLITNVPYLGVLKYSTAFKDFVDKYYSICKNDLAFVFIERLKALQSKGKSTVIAVVSPQGWIFQTRERHFRKSYLKDNKLHLMVRLGPGAFQEISGEVVQVLLSISSTLEINEGDFIFTLDIGNVLGYLNKITSLKEMALVGLNQDQQINNKDSIIDFSSSSNEEYIGKYCSALRGLSTGETNWFIRYFWEFPNKDENWEYFLSTVDRDTGSRGRAELILWEQERGIISQIAEMMKNVNHSIQSWKRGKPNWGKKGIVLNSMSTVRTSVYLGEIYSANIGVLIAKEEKYLQTLWCFFNSLEFQTKIKQLNQKLSIEPRYFEKVKFNFNYWNEIAKSECDNPLVFKLFTNDTDQWHFHGHPFYSESPLQVSTARFMGYKWPAENPARSAGGDKEMELSDEAKEKIKTIKELDLPFDEDGIVCIPPVNGETSAAERLRENIIKIWGEQYNGNTLSELIAQEGSNKRDLETYLREDFFTQHCKLFKNRPFIWHIWDGRKDGFAALVNYHKLDKSTLEKLIYTYLNDWINQCDLKRQNNVSGADGLLSAAKVLKEKLLLILEGEPPYDLFIRWKSLAEQPIGWDPDLNDGVRLNVYPFIEAGVLRKKFNVKWGKDRGKNPSSSYWGPDRWNRYEDLDDDWKLKDEQKNIIPHLTNDVKRKARKEDKTD